MVNVLTFGNNETVSSSPNVNACTVPMSAHHESTDRLSALWLRLKAKVASLHMPIVEVKTWSKERGQ